MLIAGLFGLSLVPLQTPVEPSITALNSPSDRKFALISYSGGGLHTNHGASHRHVSILSGAGYLKVAKSGRGETIYELVSHLPTWTTNCDRQVIAELLNITYTKTNLFLTRAEKGQLDHIAGTFGHYYRSQKMVEGRSPDGTVVRIPYQGQDVLRFSTTLSGEVSGEKFKLVQNSYPGAFGNRTSNQYTTDETRERFVSFAEAFLIDPGRLKGFSEMAKKGDEVWIEFLSLDGWTKQRMFYTGKQSVDFGPVQGTFDRFELRTGPKLKTYRGAIWLAENGTLAMAQGVADRDLAMTSYAGQFIVPWDRSDWPGVYPVRMSSDELTSPVSK